VKEVLLLLKAEGMTNFRSVEMSNPGRIKNIYETTIPDIYLKKDSVLEYYIQACDSQNNCRTAGSKESPYKLRVHSLEPYTEGFILDVTSQEDTVKVTISLGSLDGVKKGDRFIVFRAGRELRDPKSNELLQIEETFIGTIVIRELMSHTAYATVSKPVIPVTKNDRIRKVPSAPKAGTTEGNYAAKIVLKWAPNSEPEVEGYRIFRSSAIDGNYQKIEEITGRDNTIYEDTDDMRDGLTYYYKIAAYNILGAESQKSEPILGRTKNVGPPPAHITTEGVCVREVHLRWDTIKQDPDTKSYIVYRSDTEKGQYREIAQVDSDTGTYTDRKNLEDGKAYFYKIAARSRHGSLGDLSSSVQAKTKEVPNPPQNIIATGGLPRMVRIQWDQHGDKDIAGYIVYRNDKSTEPFTKIGETEKTEFLDKNVSDGANYLYKIASYYSVRGDEIVGPESQTVSARTKQRPKAPANVSAESGHARKAILQWNSNDEKDITEYWIYQGKEARLDRDPVAKVPVSINTFTDVNLMDNAKYYYAVKAVDSDRLESDLSNTVSALTKPLPRPPAGINGKASQGRIHLDWKPNEETDIKGYNIYRKGWLKSSLVTSVDRNSFETKLEEKIKSITMYITAVDKDDLESEPSEEIKITFE
jgi:fibronectin type 3 domain-containing protein